jgi:hypothetical protein
MNRETLLWPEAGKILAEDPTAKVRCPRNADDYLMVIDASSAEDAMLIERHLRCPTCGAYNAIRIKTS